MKKEVFLDPRDLKGTFNSKRFRDKDFEKGRSKKSGKKRLDPYERQKMRW